jgi:ribose transport system substrate-binding protein
MTYSKTARRSLMAVAGLAAASLVLSACSSGSSDTAEDTAVVEETPVEIVEEGTDEPADAGAAPSLDAVASIEDARAFVAALEQPINSWVEVPDLSSTPDIAGKTVYVIPIGGGVPVIEGVKAGIDQAITAAGAKTEVCDGKFNPTEIANCLKIATDQGAAAIVTMFIDYAMVPTAFDAAASAGIPVLVGGVTPTGGRESDATLAFFDLSAQSAQMYQATALSAVATIGEGTNAIFLRLTDSDNTKAAADAAIASFTKACPTCNAIPVDFSTPTIDKMPSAVSAALVSNPDVNALVSNVDGYLAPAVAGVQSAGAADRVQFFAANGDLDGLQRVKDGKQVTDAGIPVIYVGWQYVNALMQLLAGDVVAPVTSYEGRIFTAGNVAGLTLTPEAYLTLDWYGGNTAFEDQYLAAWGLK